MYVGLKITQHVGYVTLSLSRSLISPCLWYNPLGRRLRGREARSTIQYHEDLHKKTEINVHHFTQRKQKADKRVTVSKGRARSKLAE